MQFYKKQNKTQIELCSYDNEMIIQILKSKISLFLG